MDFISPFPEKPTTVRLSVELIEKLDNIRIATKVSRSALIALAITSFLDYVERTGKLPAPSIKKAKRGGFDAHS